jgi:hypothetical protein
MPKVFFGNGSTAAVTMKNPAFSPGASYYNQQVEKDEKWAATTRRENLHLVQVTNVNTTSGKVEYRHFHAHHGVLKEKSGGSVKPRVFAALLLTGKIFKEK